MTDRRASVFIATSLDGFIARENGDLDWLPVPEAGGEDYGYGDFMKSVDALVMGRKTYEKMLTLGGWSYGAKRSRPHLARGLIQRVIITQIPVLIGRGIPLFGPLDRDIELRHVATRSWPNGMVQSEYLVAST